MRTHEVRVACLVELAACVRVAGDLDDRRGRVARAGKIQRVITAAGVGMQITVAVGEELLRPVALAVDGEVEDVLVSSTW
jgi:hypothetical protein